MFTKIRHQKFFGIALAFAALFIYGCSENPVGVDPADIELLEGSAEIQQEDNWW